jgi:hypothetical protein
MKKTILFTLVLALLIASGITKADFTFSTPTNLGPAVNSSVWDYDSCISADGLLLFFGSTRNGGSGDSDLWVAMRATIDDPWEEPVNLGPKVNTEYADADPTISTDGLSLFFRSNRPDGYGGTDLWTTTRATRDSEWSMPVNLGPDINTEYDEGDPSISADGLLLYFCDYGFPETKPRPGGNGGGDIWVTKRATPSDPWGEPVNLGPLVNTAFHEYAPSISADGLMLFFDSDRPGGLGQFDLWVATRKTQNDPWDEPMHLGSKANSPEEERDPSISADGAILYFNSDQSGGYGYWDMWQVLIEPVVDLNSDGIVDSTDMCIMVDHWGTNEKLCDIGPMPWGDGIVDMQDIVALAEHLFTYPGAVAYWKLDEIEGNIAYNSVADCDGVLIGEPLWQPDDGMVDGAILLDGINDYVSTDYVLNPADGPFSVFAWIKGGAPGQVVCSQAGGSNWLCLDSVEGYLMTELTGSGRPASPLLSQIAITDDNWHRIGFVWDGSYRKLYVDGIVVAEDEQYGLAGSNYGLYIGCGKSRESDTFFSGLIDDVRIYNRVVNP